MGTITVNTVIGFILAILFAMVMGISMQAILVGDYLQSQNIMSEITQVTVRIAGFSGALAALLAWWAQRFAAMRGFLVRFVFALFIFVVAFFSFGGLLRVIWTHVTYPNQQDWSFTGLYFASINDFYTFVLFLLGQNLPAYLVLVVAAGIYLALFGPREPSAA
ncbi:hypothetical protein A7A08_00706 [Methyloligella halotolerans]|uniref:Uncharacterized protein n=1 Tax=Methyloligella halotolerans TaxID=1177755 RepID=A0A1E2S392_9HYPH|nr:hypothetical protein [Methyloligella halotolerans]ODA68872.1 hypothetical protein A7A08_00706 [Methyloligella halotolerans]